MIMVLMCLPSDALLQHLPSYLGFSYLGHGVILDCGSDHELRIAKFRLKLKKVGKTTRLFSYDLNQIPYDYIVEVRSIFRD